MRNVAKIRWAVIVVLILVSTHFAAADQAKTTARSATDQAERATRLLISRQCDRNQVNRSWQRVRARAAPARTDPAGSIRASDRFFPTVNCLATYDGRENRTGATIYLPHRLDQCFVRLTAHGYWTDAAGSTQQPTTDPKRLRQICATH